MSAQDQDHSHVPRVGSDNERLVLTALGLTAGFMVVELVGGLLSGSLALIADAGHMFIDAAALALAWAGFRLGRRSGDAARSFGYRRFEVLAGLFNALTLIALVLWIAVEAIGRLTEPAPVLAGPMLAIAIVGLLINLAVLAILRRGDRDHVNIRGALLHVIGDLLGSVAAILAAAVIWATGWTPIDPILSLLLSLLILRSAVALLRSAVHILMEGTPRNLDLGDLQRSIETLPGVASARHLHVWSITSGQRAATLEVHLAPAAEPATTVDQVKQTLRTEFDIGHATVEIDWAGTDTGCPIAQS